jgi:hypothetical protein
MGEAQLAAMRDLSTKYQGETGEVNKVLEAYKEILGGLSQENAGGDKVAMDRFTAMASGQAGTRLGLLNFTRGMGNILQQAQSWYQSHLTKGAGELSPEIREQLRQTATMRLAAMLDDYLATRRRYQGQADLAHVPRDRVAPALLDIDGQPRYSAQKLDQLNEMRQPGGKLAGRREGEVLADIVRHNGGIAQGAR